MIVGADRPTCVPKTFVSCLPLCWCLCIGWCNKNVQPISQCVLTSVSFIENRATHRPAFRDPGSLWCYCWTTEGIGQQISRGLSAGWDWHGFVLQNGPNARRQYCQSFCMQKCKNWGSSIVCCVMQNIVIFSVYWNQEGWSVWIQKVSWLEPYCGNNKRPLQFWLCKGVSLCHVPAHINCCIYWY